MVGQVQQHVGLHRRYVVLTQSCLQSAPCQLDCMPHLWRQRVDLLHDAPPVSFSLLNISMLNTTMEPEKMQCSYCQYF